MSILKRIGTAILIIAPMFGCTNPCSNSPERASSPHVMQDAAAHPDGCPINCKKCLPLISKVASFLAEQQEADGHWRGGHGLNHYEMTATALSGLALLAVGKDGDTTRKAVDWIIKNIDGEWRSWDYAFAGIFLAQFSRRDSREDVKTTMRKIVRTLIAFRRHGGWGHQGKEIFAYTSTMVSATNWAFLALLEMKRAGIAIDAEALKIEPYYRLTLHANGGLIYGYPTSQGGAEPGRTALALYNLRRSGESESTVYAKGLPYVRKYIQDGRIAGMGGALDYLGCAMFSYALGGEDWASYRRACFDRVLLPLTNDGFYRYPDPEKDADHNVSVPSWTDFWTQQDWYMAGPYFTQSLFLLVVALPMNNLTWGDGSPERK